MQLLPIIRGLQYIQRCHVDLCCSQIDIPENEKTIAVITRRTGAPTQSEAANLYCSQIDVQIWSTTNRSYPSYGNFNTNKSVMWTFAVCKLVFKRNKRSNTIVTRHTGAPTHTKASYGPFLLVNCDPNKLKNNLQVVLVIHTVSSTNTNITKDVAPCKFVTQRHGKAVAIIVRRTSTPAQPTFIKTFLLAST